MLISEQDLKGNVLFSCVFFHVLFHDNQPEESPQTPVNRNLPLEKKKKAQKLVK